MGEFVLGHSRPGHGSFSHNVFIGGNDNDIVQFLISAGFTALCWFLMPLVRVEDIEARAREQAAGTAAQAGS